MENKTNKKDFGLWIECLTVIALATTLTFINCHKKEDDKTPLIAAAALASRGSGTGGGTSTYSIGGTITGLTASGLVLQNNASDDLTVASGATNFTFTTKVSGAYAVTVKTQPTGLACTVSSGSGTAAANVTGISVSCSSYVLDFDGSNDRITTSTVVPYTAEYTVTAWVKTAGSGTIFCWGSTTVSNFTYLQRFGTVLRFQAGTNNLNKTTLDGGTITANVWTHVAAVRKSDNTVTTYIDGIQVATQAVPVAHFTTSPTDTSIGLGLINGLYQTGLAGQIGELTVWNVAKTATEIGTLKTTSPIGNETGLVLYYNFAQSSGSTISNKVTSGTAYDGTLNNFALTGTTSNWVTGSFR